MSADYVLFLCRETLVTAAYILAPILGAGLTIGLAVGIFQAVTQIHEMTLSLIPKIVIVGVVIVLFVPWFLDVILSFTTEVYNQIPMMTQ